MSGRSSRGGGERHGSVQGAGETGPGIYPASVLWASAGHVGLPQ